MCNITVNDIENHGNILLVRVNNTKNKIPRSFTIQGSFYEVVKKYQALRPSTMKTGRFFINYNKGKCMAQYIGVNKMGNMPKEIAKFLGLADADSYTGHSFRRTSATMLADAGADILTLKRHGGWRSNAVAETYVEDSMQNKVKICEKITNAINLDQPVAQTLPSTSRAHNMELSPTFTDIPDPDELLNDESNVNNLQNNIINRVNLPNNVTYTFQNCTFTSCFSNK